MKRRLAITLALCAIVGDRAVAQSHDMMMHHHGVPSRMIANQRVGPYLASVWIEPEVGDGSVYVMLDATDEKSFTPPSSVRVAIAPVSGHQSEMVSEAHAEPMHGKAGAQYMTNVMFDRPERWNMRIVVEGSAGGGQIALQVESTSNASLGPVGVILGSIPFLLVTLVYWRSALARRRVTLPLTLDLENPR